MRTEERRGGPGSLLPVALALFLLTVSLPIGASGEVYRTFGPCVKTSTDPPGAGVGRCGPGLAVTTAGSSGGPLVVNASIVLSDVVVDWDVDQTSLDATPVGFEVYRGVDPSMMHLVATVDADQRSYTDQMAVASGQALWYAVSVVAEDGEVQPSEPVLVSGAYAG